MRAFVCTDTHIGTLRRSGVTPLTALELGDRTLRNFETLIMGHTDLPIIHAGDLFDAMDVPNSVLLKTFAILSKWLNASGEHKFYILRANHDWHPSGGKLSSWDLLTKILAAQYGDRIAPVYGELTHLADDVWAIGHCANQSLFELNLERAMKLENSTLFFHANFDNPWAGNSDASLNVSKEWARAFVARGNRMYGGHEHQASSHLGGKVRMLGNTDATSIADCLGNEAKYAHILEEDGSLTPIQTMDVKAEFIDVPWTELSLEIDRPFVRVSGKVKSDQASDVIQAISKFRSKSKALVVSNAVKVEGLEGLDDMEDISLEQVKAFDVLGELLELLDHKERQVVRGLLEA